jgi:ABC-type phosphate transport system substrate-binding protein
MLRLIHYCRTFFSATCLLIVVGSCGSNQNEPADNASEGTIHISADESFKPVIDSQIQVYENRNPGTHIIAHYKPEAACIEDFLVDSIRMVIITRKISNDERDIVADSLRLAAKSTVIARDAIAVIVNPRAPDSLFTMAEIKLVLQGKFRKDLIPVFDATRATSTVRFIIDSVLRGDSLTPKAMGAQSSEGVIDYVSKNPNAVGFVGVSWVGNHEDTMQVSFLKKIKIAQLESRDIPGAYVLPVQANIYYGRYPLIRDVVSILKEKHNGLGHGFSYFLSGEIGQLVFRRAYLLPALQSFSVRSASADE